MDPLLGIILNFFFKLLLSLFGNLVNQVECTTLLNPSIINHRLQHQIHNFMVSKPLKLEDFVFVIYPNSPKQRLFKHC
jgi:hypothetical protein